MLRVVALVAGAVVGVLIAAVGIGGGGPALVVLGLRLAGPRASAASWPDTCTVHGPLFVAASIAVVWCVGVFAFLPDAMEGGTTINVFLLQGMILVAAAVSIVTGLDHEASALVRRPVAHGWRAARTPRPRVPAPARAASAPGCCSACTR